MVVERPRRLLWRLGAPPRAPRMRPRRLRRLMKNKHATRRFHDTIHTIVASFEPGEEWRYCYVDEILG